LYHAPVENPGLLSSAPSERPLAGPAAFGAAFAAGGVLAVAFVLLGRGLSEGLFSAATQVLERKLLKQCSWMLPAAFAAGVLLREFYAGLLKDSRKDGETGLLVLFSIVRAFFHFALYGFIALLAMLAALGLAGLRWLASRATGRGPLPLGDIQDGLIGRWITYPIWFSLLPMTLLKLENEGDLRLPVTVGTRPMLLMLPAALLCVMMWTGMRDEESGRRVDPRYLAASATLWLGDYLTVALFVMPVARARRGLRG
jgi:hypothetical protein